MERFGGFFGECKLCPGLCKSCKSENQCTECLWGELKEGKCTVSETYKSQPIKLESEPVVCAGKKMVLNGLTPKISLPAIHNEGNSLYDEMALSLIAYYDPFSLSSSVKQPSKITINVNGQSIMDIPLPTNDS